DQALGDREEEPGAGQRPTAAGADLAEGAEDPRLLFRGEAYAIVGHGESDLAVSLEAGHANLSDLGVLDGRQDEVPEHLLDPARGRDDGPQAGLDVRLDPVPLRRHPRL